MPQPQDLPGTEGADDRFIGLDTWPDEAILKALFDGQARALASVEAAIPALGRGASGCAQRLSRGGRLVYLAAGSPALIALGDMLELPQTYGIGREQLVCIMAGGHAITRNLTGTDEDRADLAEAEVAAAGVGPDDCLVAISASGSTPFTVAGLAAARRAGALTIGIAGNAAAQLLAAAEISVLLDTGAEVISGSTRLGAGTAQKVALNLFSTLIGVHLGHVHDNLMVNVHADNQKLRQRAARMVCRITGSSMEAALAALDSSRGAVKPAVLLAAGAASLETAEALLASHGFRLRPALAALAADRI